MLLLAAFFALTGATHKTSASVSKGQEQLSSCSSSLVSTRFCEEILSRSCSAPQKEQVRQIQSSVVVASAQEPFQTTSAVNVVTLPTMTPLSTQALENNTVLDSEKIFNLVNQYRVSLGLSPLEKDDKVCELAETRSRELVGELSSGTLHSGLYNRNLPYWIFENAKVGSNEEDAVAWWISSPIHRQSIVGDYKFSCVKCTGTYCSQIFTGFVPK